ncbi:adenosine deaminase [uncultured Aeromicrobium sp.]|uniref:adenosine deaminase n=1 Tax=uncultured Aeromicrobium sp. TaxID=337820 RepID=UPI0025FBE515|nr:adenosine deaminase [uncultured Aeromicrobium sp.]
MLINLHHHLEGGIRPATAAEIATRRGVPEPTGGWETALRLNAVGDLTAFLATVALSYPLMRHPDDLSRVAAEAVEDAAADGQDYLELRFGPATHVTDGVGVGEVIAAVCRGALDASRRSGLEVGLVVALLRHHPEQLNLETATAAAALAGEGVVGLDLAGDESRFPDLEPHRVAFQIARAAGLGLTCHAAEAGPASGALQAVETLGVTRIGHGVRLIDDPEARARLREHGTVIECCPTSNRYTGAVTSVTEHPIRDFVEEGLPVVLGDDNPVQTGVPLSAEHHLLSAQLGFSQQQLSTLTATSVEAAFLSDSARATLRRRQRTAIEAS